MTNFLTPLSNYTVTRTRSIDEIREGLTRVYAQPKLEPAGSASEFNAEINQCRLQHVSLGYCTYGTAVRVEFPAVDRFVQLMPLEGKGTVANGNVWVPLVAGRAAIISPEMGSEAIYDAACKRLILQIDTAALTAKLAALTGALVEKPLRMDPQKEFCGSSSQALREYLSRLVNILTTANTELPNWWVAETEQLLMLMYLFAHRHNYSHLLEQEPMDTATIHVRRAEDYIDANWQEPLTLENLAEISGVSAFCLFRAFKKTRGYSPFKFASQARARGKW